MTDGPFIESKEHIAGFYIINAGDLDAAWPGRARLYTPSTIRSKSARSLRPGRVKDSVPGGSMDQR